MKMLSSLNRLTTEARNSGLYRQAQHRWKQFNEREQRLLQGLGGVCLLAFLYFALWQPSAAAVAKAEQRVAVQQQQLRWVQQSLAKYQALQQQAQSTPQQSQQSTSQRLNAAANTLELTIARMQPQQNGMLITIDEASFATVIDFITLLKSEYSLHVSAADIARLEQPGQVRVRQLLVMDAS